LPVIYSLIVRESAKDVVERLARHNSNGGHHGHGGAALSEDPPLPEGGWEPDRNGGEHV